MSVRAGIAAAALSVLWGCGPALDGPQMMKPLPGLGYSGDCSQRGAAFGELPEVRRRCWAQLREGGASASVAHHAGAATREAVEAVVAERASGDASPTLVATRIDGRPAWAWREKAWGRVTASAAVIYPDATFVVALGAPAPDEAAERAVVAAVASFERSPGGVEAVVVPVACLGVAALAAWTWWRRRASPDRDDRPSASTRPF